MFFNVYEDTKRAESYAELEFPGTYYLAYRDLPEIIKSHVTGTSAVDVGCGAGRSTRFLQKLGFETIGIDIAKTMIKKARERDPQGDYHLVRDEDFSSLNQCSFDLALSMFTFDNVPTMDKKITLYRKMGSLLHEKGRIISLVSSPDIYTHEWASFSTKEFHENRYAGNGDIVKIIITDVADSRPVEDVLCTDEAYQKVFQKAGLDVIKTYTPLAMDHEPFEWINETHISPWVIYVLKTCKK